MGSIFSKIVKGEIPCYKIAETDRFLAFLDIFPLVKGHTLVIPKIEIDYIFDLEDEYLSEMIVFAKSISKGIRSVIPCQRIALSVIGLEVPHAHIHLLPISSVEHTNFERPKLKLESSEMEKIAKEISTKLP